MLQAGKKFVYSKTSMESRVGTALFRGLEAPRSARLHGTEFELTKSSAASLAHALRAYRVETRLDTSAAITRPAMRRHEWRRGTQKCVRHIGASYFDDISACR
jgi:hypothetical protein